MKDGISKQSQVHCARSPSDPLAAPKVLGVVQNYLEESRELRESRQSHTSTAAVPQLCTWSLFAGLCHPGVGWGWLWQARVCQLRVSLHKGSPLRRQFGHKRCSVSKPMPPLSFLVHSHSLFQVEMCRNGIPKTIQTCRFL